MEFGSTQDRLNHEMVLQRAKDKEELMALIMELQFQTSQHNEVIEGLLEITKMNREAISLVETIVSANGIALNNIEKDLYTDYGS
jgi:RecJ-like exonuclease